MKPEATAGSDANDLSALKRRVLIVDDHPLMRQGLAQLVNQQPDLTVCGEAEDVPEALQKTADLNPDVVIVDLSLKGYWCFQCTTRLSMRSVP